MLPIERMLPIEQMFVHRISFYSCLEFSLSWKYLFFSMREFFLLSPETFSTFSQFQYQNFRKKKFSSSVILRMRIDGNENAPCMLGMMINLSKCQKLNG